MAPQQGLGNPGRTKHRAIDCNYRLRRRTAHPISSPEPSSTSDAGSGTTGSPSQPGIVGSSTQFCVGVPIGLVGITKIFPTRHSGSSARN